MIELDAPQLSRFFREVLQCGPLVRVHEGHKGPFEVGWPTEPRRAPLDWESRLEGWPAHLLFLPTGELLDGSWLVVVDADLYKEGAEDSLVELHALGLPRRCPTALTPSGGEHRYYRAREPLQSGPLAGFPGIDVKCIGGGVRVYEYEYGYGLLDEPAPFLEDERLLEVLRTIGTSTSSTTRTSDRREPTLADELAVEVLVKHAGAHSARWTGRGYVLTRPGKEHGISCTVGIIEAGVVHIFTSSWSGLPAGTYSLAELCRMLGVPDPLVARLNAVAAKVRTIELTPELVETLGLEDELMTDVQMERVEWLWQARIPLGAITFLEGDPSIGKSTIALDIAARVSRGSMFPDDVAAREGFVILLSGEDHAGNTVKPRLVAAGAKLERISQIKGLFELDGKGERREGIFTLPAKIPELEALIVKRSAVLVVIDVLFSYVEGVDPYKDAETRARLLTPLAAMAERTSSALLLLRHPTKSSRGGSALHAGGGSIAFTGAARSMMLAGIDPDNPERRVLAMSKANLVPKTSSLAYVLTGAEGLDVARVEWLGESTLSADELLSKPLRGSEEEEAEGSKLDLAIAFLRFELGDDEWHHTGEIEALADARGLLGTPRGFSKRTLIRARGELGVEARPTAKGEGRGAMIRLPRGSR